MSNMSYCRFHNTNQDLGDCLDALYDMDNPEQELSEEEFRAMKRLISKCIEISENFSSLLPDE